MHYTPLYIKTDGSLLTSMIQVKDLIDFAVKHELKSLSIADHSMYNVIEFYERCKKEGIKPVIGLEISLDDKKMVLYALEYKGYQNLLKLETLQSEGSITKEMLLKHSSSLLLILPYVSKDLEAELSSIFKTIWIGYKNKEEKEKVGSAGIFMRETCCLEKEAEGYLPYLEAISKGTLLMNVEPISTPSYLELDQTLYHENNYKIYDMCNVVIEKKNNLLPIYECPDQMDAFTYLKKLCIEGMRRIFGQSVPKVYAERLKYELDVIHKMDFCNYFLVVWDYVKYAKDHDILVGPGRGSAAGSLVSYALNITTIDPIKYNLLFERFLNPERISMPDIDIDFEDIRREDMIAYCISKYGSKKVAPIITFGTLKSKQAIRDVGRCMDIPLKTIDMVCHYIDAKLSLTQNFKNNNKLQKIIKDEKELTALYKVAIKIEGLKRHSSIHAAGVVMSKTDLDEIIPLNKNHLAYYTTGYSMEYLESLGLLKMDFLSLTTLTTIHDMLKEINENEHTSLTFDSIEEEDGETLRLFETVDTVGIFQFESEGMKNFLRKLKPNTFEEIVSAIALYRPGPMDNIDSYVKRKNGEEKIEYIHDDLLPILKPTYGVIVYQEQIMQIASSMAGYSYGEADILRKAMSKKKEQVLLGEKDKFISQSINKGYTKEIATRVYDLILKFASYGFNKAHSVAYSMISYKFAYLKAHYPAYFMKSLLGSVIGNEKKTNEYIYACKVSKIEVLKPCVIESDQVYKIENGQIRFPLTGIKNVGKMAAVGLIEQRKLSPFIDIYDFIARLYSKTIHKKVLESFIYAGALACFGYNKRTLIENLDALINYAEVVKNSSYEFALQPEMIFYEEYSKNIQMEKELEVFGFYLSDHPVTHFKNIYKNTIPLQKIPMYFDKNISIIVHVDRMKAIQTKKGDTMCFITGSDELTSLDLVLFPKVYERNSEIEIGDLILIEGKVEKRLDQYQFIVRTVQSLKDNI
ncbi:MAG: DNA polymerase III subunit alpha [Bacilli bacterium]|nr:DNA polymerase III subunit alpha [Bacilli bacterium]